MSSVVRWSSIRGGVASQHGERRRFRYDPSEQEKNHVDSFARRDLVEVHECAMTIHPKPKTTPRRKCGEPDARRISLCKLWNKIDTSVGPNKCWEWSGTRYRGGYGGITLAGGKNTGSHRASWELHFGPIPDGMYVCHHCDNPPCCNPLHLFVAHQKDNMKDMRSKGRHTPLRGSLSPLSLLKEADVLKIACMLSNGDTHRTIGAAFGVSQNVISKIAIGASWRHVKRSMFRRRDGITFRRIAPPTKGKK